MKIVKKTLIIILALVLLCSLAACKQEEDKVLTMATEGTFQPFEYYEGHTLVGIDVEIAKAVAEKLGYKLDMVDTAFDSIIPGVKSGKYDFGLAGMTVTEDRLKDINFTDSYATGVQVIIVREDSAIKTVDDLFAEGANYIVAAQNGTTGFLYATRDIAEKSLGTVQGYGKTTDAASDLQLGKIDCMILDNEPAKAIVKNFEGLKILDTEYAVEEYAIAIAKDNTQLLEDVNKALAELKADGTIQTIIDKYIK